jgi:hypothetical protein
MEVQRMNSEKRKEKCDKRTRSPELMSEALLSIFFQMGDQIPVHRNGWRARAPTNLRNQDNPIFP